MMKEELAETGRLCELLADIGGGLDQYLEFKHADALQHRDQWMTALAKPLPQQGAGIDAVVSDLLLHVIPNGSPVPRPGFTSYVTTGATSAAALAMTAASVASPQRYLLTAFNYLEELSLDWLAQMFGLNAMKGIYSSGGSVANLLALGAARQSCFEKIGVDPARDGLSRIVSVYATSECHHTVQRAAGVLGIGRKAVHMVDCDAQGRMRVDLLKAAIQQDILDGVLPMAIVANAGTTTAGAIDPLQAIGEIAKEYDLWFHVDGAYGLPAILDERVAGRFKGLDLADSIIVDPHKWLGATVGISATFVRDRSLLERAFTQEAADYLEGSIDQSGEDEAVIAHSLDDFGVAYYNYGVELSSPCRGVAVWAMICEIGVEGMRARIKRHNDMAAEIARVAKEHSNLELLLEPTLSIVCFRYVTADVSDLDHLNQRLHRQLVRENEYMPSTTRINGKLALRPCFIGARTGSDQINGLLDAVLRIGRSIAEQY